MARPTAEPTAAAAPATVQHRRHGNSHRHRGARRPLGALEFIQRLRDNAISIYPPETFAADYGWRRLGWQRFVLLNHPDYIKHVLVTNHQNYGKGRLNRQILGPVLGRGLLTSEGAFWRRQRRIAAPAFHHKRLAALADIMVDCAEAQAERWHAPAANGVPRDVAKDMSATTMEIVARTLFSSDITADVDQLGGSLTQILRGFGRPSLLDLLGLPEWLPRRRDPEAVGALLKVDRMIRGILKARRAAGSGRADGGRADLLAMLLDARDPETGEGMSDRQLRDEIMTLFAAGHETTANLMTWTWYLLSQDREVEARLHHELDAELAGRRLQYTDLERLPFCRMVLDEALRLYPPAFTMNRVALAPDRIGPVEIGRGDLISISPYVTHRNPKLWDEPDRFDPERFRPDRAEGRPKFAYFPFGGGPRVCIGNSFALMEARIVLASLARRYSMTLQDGLEVVPHGRITLRPRYGLRMTIQARGP